MNAKLLLILAVTGVLVSQHLSNGHAIGIDKVKEKGIETIAAVKLASEKVGAAATLPLALIKKKALLAVKVPILLAKKKLAAGLALKKAKIIAPILLFKAAKKAIEAKIVEKKLKLSALKAAVGKHIALAKLLKLAKIPLLLWKLKLPIIAVKKAITAYKTKKLVALATVEHAAKLAALKKLAAKGALTKKLSLPVPLIKKETDLGLGALLSGVIPFLGSSLNSNGAIPFIGSALNSDKKLEIPDVVYQFIPDYATQFKNVQIIPNEASSVNAAATKIYEEPSQASLSNSQGIYPASIVDEPSIYGLPSDTYALPKL